jgi:hypothetical protein
MSSHDITELGFAMILTVGATLEVLARANRIGLPTIDQTITRVMRSPGGRIGMLSLWFWLGWHFLAR